MEKEFQTSFIPKKPVVEEPRAARSRPVGVFLLIGILAFVVSVLFGAGVYFYRSYLAKRVDSLGKSLVLAEDEFERGVIDELERLERRLDAGSEILANHLAVSPVFETLEESTLPTVRFTGFSFDKGKEESGTILVELSGEAVSYTEVALQSDLFSKNRNFRNIVFSDLELSDKGTVTFGIAFSVDPSFLRFAGAEAVFAPPPAPTTFTPPETPQSEAPAPQASASATPAATPSATLPSTALPDIPALPDIDLPDLSDLDSL